MRTPQTRCKDGYGPGSQNGHAAQFFTALPSNASRSWIGVRYPLGIRGISIVGKFRRLRLKQTGAAAAQTHKVCRTLSGCESETRCPTE